MRTTIFAVLVSLAGLVPAQAQTLGRAWMDVDVTQGQAFAVAQTISRPSGSSTLSATYPDLGGAVGVHLSGGYALANGLGIGVHYTAINTDHPASLGVSMPGFIVPRTASSVAYPTGQRRDRALDLSGVYAWAVDVDTVIRADAGPTYFHVSEDRTSSVIVNTQPALAVASGPQREVTGTGWGLHAGISLAWYAAKHVGVGAAIRVQQGSVTIVDPLSQRYTDLNAGHIVFGAGLRLRF
ncbi:MAG: hypothetical protein WBD07_12255 [Vicinamibacterales bacterium]